jgi:3-deoxy-D-manno-octulosonic-acid transferase
LERLFPNAVRFSNYSNQETNVLLVDSIGILAQLYGHADVAYVGGGFGSGLHNILEATAYGIPVIFGPDHGRFADAGIMVNEGLAYSINTAEDLRSTIVNVLAIDGPDPAILAFMNSRTGAKRAILNHLNPLL